MAAPDEPIAALTARCRDARAAGGPSVAVVWSHPPTPAEIGALAEAGASELVLPLQGARAEVHDWHAGAGTFEASLRALTAARSNGLATAVTTRATRSNVRVLVELPGLLRARGVSTWLARWPRAAEGDPGFTRVVPRLGLGVPPLLAAIDRATKLKLRAYVLGLPACVLGPLAAHGVSGPARAFGAPCAACAARPVCSGVDAAYLERFGSGELHPLGAAPPAPSGVWDVARALLASEAT